MDPDRNVILTGFIQIVGLTAAIIFGVFSALSWSQAVKASYEAAAANTIAMFTLCSSQDSTDIDQLGPLCISITGAAQQSLSAVASSLFPSQATTAPTPTARSNPLSIHDVSTIMIVVCGTLLAVTGIITCLTWFGRRKRTH